MKKKFLYLSTLLILSALYAGAQTYTPIALTGYNHDVVAEVYPNSQSTTDTVLDGSNYVIYSQAFAAAGSFAGGLPNNGLITDASTTRQFQLASYTALNALNVMRNASRLYTLVTPAAYQKLSVLAFSTEGPSQINITLNFSDGTSTTVLTNYNLPDWFNNTTNVALTGFGRVTRTTTATAVNGPTTNPNMYYIDINVSCTDRKKTLQSIRFDNVTTTGTNAPYPNSVFLAVSGQTDTQAINSSSVPVSCGVNNGSATVNVTGNTGPYSISWNTTPVQTTPTISNLAAGTYIASITDVNGCVTTRSIIVTQLVSPSSITATATPSTICSGSSTQLAVNATGGTLANYTWTPGGATTATVNVTPTTTTTYSVLGQDAAGCPYSRQVTVTVNQRPTAPVVPNVQVCGGNIATLSVQLPQSGLVYNWYTAAAGGSPVATGATYSVSTSGSFTYYVEAVNAGCTSSARTAATVSLFPGVQVNAGADQTIVSGDVVQLNGTGSAGTYLWSPATALSATNILNPMANPTTTTTYTLSVTNAQGCVSTDAVTITVVPYCIKPMEAFTPNGDGINDFWRVGDFTCIANAKVGVYNRYGSPVYQSEDYKNNWDGKYEGKPLPDGTYYFVITYQLINGKKVFLKGNVTILR